MNNNTFERIVEDTLGMAQRVLIKKSGEYSSNEDKLHNFEAAKSFMRCKTKEYALLGMLNKHLVSVIDMVEKFEKGGELPTSNMIDEKIGDSINYFILLKACFYDDMIKAETEKGCKCDCEREKEKDDKITIDWLRKKREELRKIDEMTENTGGCFDKNKDCPERAMSLTEILKQNEGAIANSMYQNPRKRLVVEKLRKLLKPLFVWLTDNNRFVDYEKIKGILNKAETEQDSVSDEFVKDVIVAIEQLGDLPREWYQLRCKVITEIIQIMIRPKYKVGDNVWRISFDIKHDNWIVRDNVQVQSIGLFVVDKKIAYISEDGAVSGENFCFKTREEAQQECNNRNNTNKIIEKSAKENCYD